MGMWIESYRRNYAEPPAGDRWPGANALFFVAGFILDFPIVHCILIVLKVRIFFLVILNIHKVLDIIFQRFATMGSIGLVIGAFFYLGFSIFFI